MTDIATRDEVRITIARIVDAMFSYDIAGAYLRHLRASTAADRRQAVTQSIHLALDEASEHARREVCGDK